MAIDPYTFFRVYDQGISNWVNNIAIINGDIVPHVMASPQRAFSTMRDVLIKQGKLTKDATLDMVPLPFISIQRGDPALNLKYWSRARLRNMRFTDSSKRFTETSQFPQPYLLPYSIEVWSKYVQSDAELFDRLQFTFASSMAYMGVTHRDPWNHRFTAIHLDSISNNSKLEGGTMDERDVRHTYRVSVEAWLFFTPTEVPTALKFSTQFYSYGGKDVGTGVCPPSECDFLEEITEEYVP